MPDNIKAALFHTQLSRHLTDDVKEANLALGDAPLPAVKQGRDGQAKLLFSVTLPK